ncbi:MAG TPA: TorF family putative porin [Opitutaceae bacterium]|nr:TorF family putative porin [Opitutaceae bacterium]
MNKLLRPKTVGIAALFTLGHCLHAQTAPSTPAPPATGGAAPSAPAPAAPDSSVSVVVTPAFVNQYMFRGSRLGGPSFEPTVEVDSGNLALGVWMNFPMKDKVPGQSDPEIDPYGSYTLTVNDAVSVAPGFTWYNYPNADTNNGFFKATFEPNIALNYTVAGVKFTPKLYYDLVLKGPTYEFSLAYAVPLKEIGSELDWTATAGTFIIRDAAKGADPAVKNWGNYYLIGVSMPFALSKASKLSIGFAYTKGTSNFIKQGSAPRVENTAAVGRGVVTLGYSYTF